MSPTIFTPPRGQPGQQTRSGRRLLACLLTLALSAGCQPADDEPRTTPDTPRPERTSSRFLNIQQDYVGSEQCVTCHKKQHQTWQVTAHARSMAPVQPDHEPDDGQFVHAPSGRHYAVNRVQDQLHHRESLVNEDGSRTVLSDHPLKYLVGSGRFSRTYLVEIDGFLVESPVTWYASRKAWDMSPGYDHSRHDSFRRRANQGCLLCHAGLVTAAEPHGFTFPHKELAIGCERCHGPGSAHVKRHQGNTAHDASSNGTLDLTIVNPTHLTRDLAEAICQQCHLQGDVKVLVRGRRPGDFRPGLPLADERVEYRLDGSGPEMTVVGHVDQLQQSRCYQQAQSLSCVTCHDPHDPHEPRSPREKLTYQRTVCLECHKSTSCQGPAADRQATAPVADACTSCHMPQVPTEIPHIAFTHHRIAVHKSPVRKVVSKFSDTNPDTQKLVTCQDLSRFSSDERNRMLGLAYLRLHFQRQWSHGTFLTRADALLNGVAPRISGDGELDAARAEIAWERGDRRQAGQLAQQALQQALPTDAEIQASHVRVQILIEKRKFRTARKLLTRMTRLRRNPLHWALLGHCNKELGRTREAITAFEQALQIAPGQGALHAVLVPLYRQTKNISQADHHQSQARLFPPNGFPRRKK